MSSWPWFPFFVDDFLASPKVRRMNTSQIGTYLLLMCEQWQVGYVDAADMDELAKTVKSKPDQVQKILRDCFEETSAGWVNLKLDELRQGQDVKSSKAKAAALARWKNHATKAANASPEHMRTHSGRNAIVEPDPDPEPDTPPSVEAREGKAKRKRALPPDWKPNEGHHAQARRDGLNVELEAEQFRDHHTAKGSVMLDWDAAFRTWLRNAKKFAERDAKAGRPKADNDAAQVLLARQAEGWAERKRATEEAIARDLAKRQTAPPIANDPSGPLAGLVARVMPKAG